MRTAHKHNTKDALGNEIEINGTYGYHRYQNGRTTNAIARVLSIEEGYAKVVIINKFEAIYEDEVHNSAPFRPKTTVKANSLFKLEMRQ